MERIPETYREPLVLYYRERLSVEAVARENGQLRVCGSKRLVMTEWGVRPPTLMLGTMKVNPSVTVGFDVVLKLYGMLALVDLVEKGQLTVTIDSVFPLADAAKAHERGETGRARGKIVLTVRDDGRGLPPAASKSSHGIRGMRERAMLIGATFAIKAAPERGTEVRLSIPLDVEAAAPVPAEPAALHRPVPALLGLDQGYLTLSVPAVEVREVYSKRELHMYGVRQEREVRMPVFNIAF